MQVTQIYAHFAPAYDADIERLSNLYLPFFFTLKYKVLLPVTSGFYYTPFYNAPRWPAGPL
jgi:hypothetical protein